MRDIKFRAWDKSERQMTMTETLPRLMSQDSLPESWVKDMVFMQYTGLKDKRGVEIYEGDIIAHISTRRAGYQKDGDMIYRKIVFGKTNTRESSLTDYIGFWAVSLSDDCIDCGGSIEYQTKSHDAIVIGNIYENPELLNDQ